MRDIAYEVHIDWDNDGTFDDADEDVSADAQRPITIEYGRDQARSLAPMAAGRVELDLKNKTGAYSPENTSSPLWGKLKPGRQCRVQAVHDSTTYVLYRGFLDGFQVKPELGLPLVSLSALDALARLKGVTLSTPVYASLQTGDAIHKILDAVGWPTGARDIDQGATTIRWWWEEGTDALAAIENVVNSEGPPALLTVSSDGDVVFRDRHHRMTRTGSLTSQATFSPSGSAEPVHARPLVYDIGWRDVINSVSIDVDELRPAAVLDDVFETEQQYSIAARETIEVGVSSTQPFINAVTPASGTDYTLRSGSVSVALSRTSGEAVTIRLTAGSSGAVVEGLRLRAFPLEGTPLQVSVEDPLSIDEYGRRSYPHPAPWCGVHDAKAIAELILAHRSTRLPTVSMRLQGSVDERILQQLVRDLSDRITIIEPSISLAHDFYIDRIQHTISGDGKLHETTFGCEMVPAGLTRPFQFDVTDRGFDQGAFGGDDPATVFRLNTSGQGLSQGRLAT